MFWLMGPKSKYPLSLSYLYLHNIVDCSKYWLFKKKSLKMQIYRSISTHCVCVEGPKRKIDLTFQMPQQQTSILPCILCVLWNPNECNFTAEIFSHFKGNIIYLLQLNKVFLVEAARTQQFEEKLYKVTFDIFSTKYVELLK